MSDATGPQRLTLDSQLVAYWEREAARFDDLAKRAAFKWMARGFTRRAESARVEAGKSRTREAARGRDVDPA